MEKNYTKSKKAYLVEGAVKVGYAQNSHVQWS